MSKNNSALIIGASRGLGLAITRELLERGWKVTATVRGESRTGLHELVESHPGTLDIEHLEMTVPAQIEALKSRLSGSIFDLLFVNAGITHKRHQTIGEFSTEEFVNVMVTNALAPLRVLEHLTGNVRSGGTVGVMSSGRASITNNKEGEDEVYRASKAALNMLMQSFAIRQGQDHALFAMAPGWIQTDMGGSQATFTIAEVIHDLVDTILAQEGQRGLRYINRFGEIVPW
jgi:NAD(P)-dependent dehydrogenase (short-subunit alcohol dehydrogenase family)